MSRCLVILLSLNAAIAASLSARSVLRDIGLDGLQYQMDDVRDLLPLRSLIALRTQLGDEDEDEQVNMSSILRFLNGNKLALLLQKANKFR